MNQIHWKKKRKQISENTIHKNSDTKKEDNEKQDKPGNRKEQEENKGKTRADELQEVINKIKTGTASVCEDMETQMVK